MYKYKLDKKIQSIKSSLKKKLFPPLHVSFEMA